MSDMMDGMIGAVGAVVVGGALLKMTDAFITPYSEKRVDKRTEGRTIRRRQTRRTIRNPGFGDFSNVL